MLIDFFLFVNEFEVLEIRLHEMYTVVDKIVIVEGRETFSGIEKSLQFDRDRFEQFRSKIIYVVPPKTDPGMNSWNRQKFQRDYVMKAVKLICTDDDLFLIGDIDEIVSRRSLEKIVNDDNRCADKRMQTFIQRNFIYFLNRMRPGGWPGSILISYRLLNELFNGSLYEARMARRSGRVVKKAGWHFSNLGGYDNIVRKLKASSHHDSTATYRMLKDAEHLKDKILGNIPIKGRKLVTVPTTTEWFPEWLVENKKKFNHLMF